MKMMSSRGKICPKQKVKYEEAGNIEVEKRADVDTNGKVLFVGSKSRFC